MLDILLSCFWFHNENDLDWLQSLNFRYFTELILGSFENLPIIVLEIMC